MPASYDPIRECSPIHPINSRPRHTMPPFTPTPGLNSLSERLADALPAKTLAEPPTLVIRQDAPPATVTVYRDAPDSSGNDLSGGEIAGIVIGSVIGFLLLLWLIRSCVWGGAGRRRPPPDYYHHEEPKRRRRSRHGHSQGRHRSRSIGAPPPVVIRDYSRSPGRGRQYSRGGY